MPVTPTPTTPAAPAVASDGVPAAAQPPSTVTIPAEHFAALQSLQTKIADLEAANARREQEARDEQIKLLQQKGDAENAVKTLREQKEAELRDERTKAAALEERAKRYALDGELSRALAAQPLVSAAAAQQLTAIFRSELQVQPEGDGFAVRTRTLQPVGDFIKERLAHPDYAHFVRAQSTGGTAGATGGGGLSGPTGPAQPAAPETPKTFSEAIIMDMKARAAAEALPPSLDRRQSFGLRPLARQA